MGFLQRAGEMTVGLESCRRFSALTPSKPQSLVPELDCEEPSSRLWRTSSVMENRDWGGVRPQQRDNISMLNFLVFSQGPFVQTWQKSYCQAPMRQGNMHLKDPGESPCLYPLLYTRKWALCTQILYLKIQPVMDGRHFVKSEHMQTLFLHNFTNNMKW